MAKKVLRWWRLNRDRLLAWWRQRHPRLTPAQQLGRRGERDAARLLTALGMDILVRNYRLPEAEIDLVARDGTVLCFVEVKALRNVTQRRPSDQVDQDKRVHLSRAARHYLAGLGNPPLAYRFDVVELVYHGWRVVEARHWPAEFPEVVAPHARRGD
jgi:putative endonuclease